MDLFLFLGARSDGVVSVCVVSKGLSALVEPSVDCWGSGRHQGALGSSDAWDPFPVLGQGTAVVTNKVVAFPF